MLHIENLHVHYGAIHALKGVSLAVEAGQIVSLIGANGAGKTTLLHAISALCKPSEGRIVLNSKEITKTSAKSIVAQGLIHVPEGRRIFAGMTVEENLLMGAYLRKNKQEIRQDIDYVCSLFPRLQERKKQQVQTLSGGEQQMLAIARALMAKPKLLLLDEPSMGLSPLLVKEIFKIIEQINAQGVAILLVEQNAKMALNIAQQAYVLENGSLVLQGTGKELAHSEAVKKAYLGG
ncbi:MAG: ABC transporter ATP-binding protein [Eubacteriales bacterium]|nr:ABC transporter ATP-binding protein [Eubacteriales bacterium]